MEHTSENSETAGEALIARIRHIYDSYDHRSDGELHYEERANSIVLILSYRVGRGQNGGWAPLKKRLVKAGLIPFDIGHQNISGGRSTIASIKLEKPFFTSNDSKRDTTSREREALALFTKALKVERRVFQYECLHDVIRIRIKGDWLHQKLDDDLSEGGLYLTGKEDPDNSDYFIGELRWIDHAAEQVTTVTDLQDFINAFYKGKFQWVNVSRHEDQQHYLHAHPSHVPRLKHLFGRFLGEGFIPPTLKTLKSTQWAFPINLPY